MKKRVLTALLALVMAFTLLPGAALAAGAHVNVNSLSYKVTSDNTVTITGCPTTATGTLDIPATIGGLPVTKIGNNAFDYCAKITYVTIPSGVTVVDDRAFRNCKSLYGISIPDTVTSIGYQAFLQCSSLLSVRLPEGLKQIEDGAFRGCESLESVYIPASVTQIGSGCFNQCYNLKNVTLPKSVSKIGEYAFCGCAFESIVLPSSLETVEKGTFSYCANLESVSIPNGVKEIGAVAFSGSGLKTVTLPDSVTSIGSGAFEECTSLTSATINGAFTALSGGGIFDACSSLETVIINAPITSIGNNGAFAYYNPFNECFNLETIYLPGTLYEVKMNTFISTSALTDVYFAGSAYDWAGVGIGSNNEYLTAAKIHYIPFKDVKPGDWFYNSVDYVVEHGLMNGTGSTTFAPDGVITRGEILTLLARNAGVDTVGGATWYTKGVEWAKKNGVSDGEEPLEQITRAELATLLYRCANSPAVSTSQMNKWPDASSIPTSEAASAMAWCVENGIINGTGDGKLLPLGTASRKEVAVMIQRYCEKLA